MGNQRGELATDGRSEGEFLKKDEDLKMSKVR